MHKADNNGCAIHYTIDGAGGRDVVLIPGLGGSCVQMAGIRNALARHFRVITIDPRGGGESDHPDQPYTAADLVADTVAVMDACGSSAADFIGISFGAMIAQEVAIREPQRTRSLLLASSYAAADAWSRQMWQVRESLIENQGLRAHMELAVMFLFSPRTFRTEHETVERLQAAFAGLPDDSIGYRRQLAYCRDHDTTDRLHAIKASTHVVTGAEDILCSPLQGRELAEGILGASYEEIDGAAHLFMLSQPERFASLSREFIERVPLA